MEIFKKVKESLFGPAIDYKQLLEDGAVVVDVRSETEFNSGHVEDSLNIPVHELSAQLNQFKDKVVILVCRSGMRAENAKSLLRNKGIEAYNAGPWQTIDKLS